MGPESKEPSSQPSGSYLYDVLADGARSFPFRGGVSSLLGISDGGNGFIKLPPTFHPLGFIRPQRARGRSVIPDLHPSASTRCMSSSPAVRGNEPYDSCFEECEVAQHESVAGLKEEVLPKRCNGNYGMKREYLAATPEKAATGVVSRRIEIPGVSDGKVTFHHLSTLYEDQSGPAELILHERNSSHDIRRQLGDGSHNEQRKARESKEIRESKSQYPDSVDKSDCAKQALHMNKPDKATSAVISGRMEIPCDDMTIEKAMYDTSGIKLVNGKGKSLCVNEEDSTMSAPLKHVHKKRDESLSEARLAIRSMPESNLFAGIPEDTHLRGTATDSQENGSLSEHPRLNGTLVKKTDFRMQNSCVAQHDRDMAGVLNTLENHLRQKIDQLRDASKKRPLISAANVEETEKNREQEQIQQKQLPLQPRIVVVRHSSRRNSAPAAFWERSYLGRFRLRPLR